MAMDPVATGAEARETRILAAIVFTDVVGFSRLAAQNEARVYVALQRDMGVMTNLCRAHGGQVLNTMGDGMLLCFMSAVDAMTCAIEIQRTLFNQARSLPPTDVLQHRVGVHLGDVIMSGDNVFGDGVNVAARLQAIAKPGGICFSDTVEKVVKNKLYLADARYAGNQQLKNLGEPVKVWQVPPLEEARRPVILDDIPKAAEAEGAGGLKALVMVVASLVLVGGIVGAFMVLRVPPPKMAQAKPKGTNPDKPAPTTPSPTTPSTVPSTPGMSPEQIATELNNHKASFDFAGMIQVLDRAGKDAPAAEIAKVESYRQLASLMAYLNDQASKATIDAPMRFDGVAPDGAPKSFELFGVSPSLTVKVDGVSAQMDWRALGPANVLAAARSVAEMQVRLDAPAPPEAKDWLETFAREFNL